MTHAPSSHTRPDFRPPSRARVARCIPFGGEVYYLKTIKNRINWGNKSRHVSGRSAAVGLVPLAGLLAKVRARRGGGYGADSFAYPAAANEPVIAPARAPCPPAHPQRRPILSSSASCVAAARRAPDGGRGRGRGGGASARHRGLRCRGRDAETAQARKLTVLPSLILGFTAVKAVPSGLCKAWGFITKCSYVYRNKASKCQKRQKDRNRFG